MELTFTGNLTNDGVGLYWSSYQDGGQTVYLATTKFEAPYARRAFPCFDEPHMKALFDITLVRKKNTGRNYKSFSNADVNRTVPWFAGYEADIFRTTPLMSTYLLAFIVCDFDALSNMTPTGVLYRTLARPNAIQFAHLAQDSGVALFDWLETKFDPAYPISKLDNIAIPDFLSGAMENWGLITYRETLLYEEGVTTASDKDWIVEVVAHELSHMWFGNIVSPKWWSWLWLNEAFASYLDYFSVEILHPNWRMTDQFIVQSMHSTMNSDSLRTSHPMTVKVESPSEIQAIFDGITYTKGASIVRMMHLMLGDDTFYNGLNLYLDTYKYDVAEHQNLFDSLTLRASVDGRNIDVSDVMDPWVTQMNYPVLHVSTQNAFTIFVRQERFLSNKDGSDTGDAAPYGYTWDIPVTYTSSDELNFDKSTLYEDIMWITRQMPDRVIVDASSLPDFANPNSWVIVNVKQMGFYRVNYDERNWNALINQLLTDHTVIHPINRGQIINDAWSLAKAGMLNQSIALRTLDFLENEMDYVPWRAFAREIGYLDDMLKFSDLYGDFQAMMRKLVEKPFSNFGMINNASEPPIDIFARSRIVNYACSYGIAECQDFAFELFKQWMNDTSATHIDPDLRSTLLCTAIIEGGVAEWEFALQQYYVTDRSSEKTGLLSALACSREPWLLNRLLAMSLNPNEVRSQDSSTVISEVSQNPIGHSLAWAFFRRHFDELVNKMTSSRLRGLISTITSSFNTEFQLQELQNFIAGNDVTVAESAFKSAVEEVENNIIWMSNNYDIFKNWLSS